MAKIAAEAKAATDSPPTDSRELMKAIADLVALVEPRLMILWQEAGMTLSQRRVLRRLTEGPRTAGDLAAALDLSSPSLTRVLTKLELLGLLKRSVDPADRRRIVVELTTAGRRSLEHHRVFSGTSLVKAARGLSAEQQAALAGQLSALVRVARAMESVDASV